jgi:hypothetical protein
MRSDGDRQGLWKGRAAIRFFFSEMQNIGWRFKMRFESAEKDNKYKIKYCAETKGWLSCELKRS